MSPAIDPDPDQILNVGHDGAGHWLVQDGGGGMEGCFVSFAAALSFARAEQQACPGASIVIPAHPLVPRIALASAVHALPRAA